MQFQTKYQGLLALAAPHIEDMDAAVAGLHQVRRGLIKAADNAEPQKQGQLVSLYQRFGNYINTLRDEVSLVGSSHDG